MSGIAEEEKELVAVIAAAILMMETAENGQHLAIRDIRYVGTAESSWAAAGRKDLMNQRNGRGLTLEIF